MEPGGRGITAFQVELGGLAGDAVQGQDQDAVGMTGDRRRQFGKLIGRLAGQSNVKHPAQAEDIGRR